MSCILILKDPKLSNYLAVFGVLTASILPAYMFTGFQIIELMMAISISAWLISTSLYLKFKKL